MKSRKSFSMFLFFGLILGTFTAFGQNDTINFELIIRREKFVVGKKFDVEFSINADGNNFNPPSFEGFRKVNGPSLVIASTVNIRDKRTFAQSYLYTLKPIKIGNFSIDEATIEFAGITFKTIPREIQVVNK